jgi:hypothetical protein
MADKRTYRITIVAELSGVIAPEDEVKAAVSKIRGMKVTSVTAERVLLPHEEREVLRQHADRDTANGRDWNDPKRGCDCTVCLEYRRMGYYVTQEEKRV